jgi:hypothetical protein
LILPLLFLMFFMGVYPAPFFEPIALMRRKQRVSALLRRRVHRRRWRESKRYAWQSFEDLAMILCGRRDNGVRRGRGSGARTQPRASRHLSFNRWKVT